MRALVFTVVVTAYPGPRRRDVLGDNAKATRELGIEHRPFREGLRETLREEQAQLRGWLLRRIATAFDEICRSDNPTPLIPLRTE